MIQTNKNNCDWCGGKGSGIVKNHICDGCWVSMQLKELNVLLYARNRSEKDFPEDDEIYTFTYKELREAMFQIEQRLIEIRHND